MTVEDRLRLIDEIWQSIEEAAANGDSVAADVLQKWEDLDPDFLDELQREADYADAHPETLTSWDDLLIELKRKYG